MVQTSEYVKTTPAGEKETSRHDIAPIFRELIALMPLVVLEEMRRELETAESKGKMLQTMVADIGREIAGRSYIDRLRDVGV